MSLNLGSIPPPHTSSLPPPLSLPGRGRLPVSHGRIPTDDRARAAPPAAVAERERLSPRFPGEEVPQAGAVGARSIAPCHGPMAMACWHAARRKEGQARGRGWRWCIAMNVPSERASERGRSLCNVETNMHSLSFSLTLSPSLGRREEKPAARPTVTAIVRPTDRPTGHRTRYVFQASGHRKLELRPPGQEWICQLTCALGFEFVLSRFNFFRPPYRNVNEERPVSSCFSSARSSQHAHCNFAHAAEAFVLQGGEEARWLSLSP